MDRAAWLKDRQTGVTATDVRRLVCPWDADRPEAAAIWDEKKAAEPVESDAPILLIGLATEPLNARLYTQRTGFEVATPPPLIRHPDDPWQVASLDRVVVGDGRPVELKYTRFFNEAWGEQYTDEIPVGYLVQVTWQMRVSGVPFADVSAIDGGGDHRLYRVGYDAALSDALAEIAADFWSLVLTGVRPAEDWVHPVAARLLEQREAAVAGRRVKLADPRAEFRAWEWMHAKSVEKDAVALADECRAELVGLMGDAEEAEAGPYLLSRKPRARLVKPLPAPNKRKAVTL